MASIKLIEEDQRLKEFKKEENLKIKTTTYEDGSISAGGYDGSIMIRNEPKEKYYFFGVAKNKSINEFKRIYPKLDKDNVGKLEFGMSEGGTPLVKIGRINGKPYSIDHEERKYTKGERKGQRMQSKDTIKTILGSSLYDEIDERERTIKELNETNEELRKTNEEIRKKAEELSQEKEENNNEIRELKGKSKENEEAISSSKKDKKQLKKEKDEALKQAKEDYEEKLKYLKQTIMANEREKWKD